MYNALTLNDFNQIYNAGIYVRLSRDDDEKFNGKSESIQNQINYLTKYVVENQWNLINIYQDDGYSGTNFDRPGFKQLIRDIEDKKINLVVTKDLSRLGRDYIETGNYLEKYFPKQNVRYIAVNDGIDTFSDSSNNDMSPFKSVINDMYAKDISKKVRSVIDNKRINGDFIGSFAPYGYIKDPHNKNKLIIDEDTSYIVRRIYEMYLQGHGYSYIANTLNLDGVPSPAAYKESKANYKNPKSIYKLWTHETIKKILSNPTYKGNVTQRKYTKVNYKIKQLVAVPKSKWITVCNTHPPLIDSTAFDAVQNIIGKNAAAEYTEKKYSHLLSGILFCGDCGSRMTFFKAANGNMYVICSKYKRFPKLGACTRHSMPEKAIEACVLENLKAIAKKALNISELTEAAQKGAMKGKNISSQLEKKQIESKLESIKRTIRSLYDDKVKDIIAEEDFINLSRDYNRERVQLTTRLNKIIAKGKEQIQQNCEPDNLTELVNKIAGFETPDKKVLSNLIDRIEIFESKKIKIYYKFKNPYLNMVT